MLLEKLSKHADQLYSDPESPMPPPMYQFTHIPWLIDLDINGTFRGLVRTTEHGDGTELERKRNGSVPFAGEN